MRTAAVLPVKRFARAKQRLRASVTDALRLELAGAMVEDVLDALARAHAIERTILVTGEHAVAHAAHAHAAIVVADGLDTGQPAAASLGVQRALHEGYQRVLCVPGDCPALDPRELDELLDSHARPGVVILPDRHGAGTNGLLLAPPDAISPSFGPGSCERHQQLARAAGVACRVARVPSLLLDIDTSEDLHALRARLAGHPERAPRTRAVLAHDERAHVLSVKTPA
ncbi:MAG TPA: 2-phospho-L-lactate guanylyltransferase [Solirubrobacteraceae bacterium]|nr:2-phospho-L-lactate guanylyltransferase [Solirubrobacteraceae bacterium]